MAVAILAFTLVAVSALAQSTEREWQAKAVEKYPALGVSGSAFNKHFIEVHAARRRLQPEFFKNPRWPLLLADEVAATDQVPPTTAVSIPPASSSPLAKPSAATREAPPTGLTPGFGDSSTADERFHLQPGHFVLGAIALGIVATVFSAISKAQRRAALMAKYGDEKIVERSFVASSGPARPPSS